MHLKMLILYIAMIPYLPYLLTQSVCIYLHQKDIAKIVEQIPTQRIEIPNGVLILKDFHLQEIQDAEIVFETMLFCQQNNSEETYITTIEASIVIAQLGHKIQCRLKLKNLPSVFEHVIFSQINQISQSIFVNITREQNLFNAPISLQVGEHPNIPVSGQAHSYILLRYSHLANLFRNLVSENPHILEHFKYKIRYDQQQVCFFFDQELYLDISGNRMCLFGARFAFPKLKFEKDILWLSSTLVVEKILFQNDKGQTHIFTQGTFEISLPVILQETDQAIFFLLDKQSEQKFIYSPDNMAFDMLANILNTKKQELADAIANVVLDKEKLSVTMNSYPKPIKLKFLHTKFLNNGRILFFYEL